MYPVFWLRFLFLLCNLVNVSEAVFDVFVYNKKPVKLKSPMKTVAIC